MSIFSDVKAAVPVREAVIFYGTQVNRAGMACCPFHPDKTPSMLVDGHHFHCFGCQAAGDVIQYAASMFHLSQYDAAHKLADDFHVTLTDPPKKSAPPPKKPSPRPQSPYKLDAAALESMEALEARVAAEAHAHQRAQWLTHAVDVLSRYRVLLQRWKDEYAPKTEDEEWHPKFIESNAQSLLVDFMLALADDPLEQEYFYKEYREEVARIETEINRTPDA